MKTFKENINRKIIEYKLANNLKQINQDNKQELEKMWLDPEEKIFSKEYEIKIRDLIDCIIESNIGNIKILVEDVKLKITWLIWIENLEYENLIKFKREGLEIYDFEVIEDFEKLLTNNQKQLVENYKTELYDSVIYWPPINETEKEYRQLLIWEDLFNISKSIKEILYNLNN